MLKVAGGFKSLDALMQSTVPDAIRREAAWMDETPVAESEALAQLRAIAKKNSVR
jgi:glycine cleavage system pyridoxal-binding protein P